MRPEDLTAALGARLDRAWPGKPYPSGAEWDGDGANFALWSRSATGVDVCLFDPDGVETRIALDERQIGAGDREANEDRLDLIDHHERRALGRVHEIAFAHQERPGATADRCAHGGVAEIEGGVGERSAVCLDRCDGGGGGGANLIGLLVRDVILLD